MVPCDGDCLAWSLRAACVDKLEDYETEEAVREVLEIRELVADCWITHKCIPFWQKLFNAFCADGLQVPDPETPKKSQKPNREADANVPLQTPPRVDPKQKALQDAEDAKVMPAFQRVKGAEPVPIAARERAASLTLMKPQKRKARKLLEPEVPDLEAAFDETMLDASEPSSSSGPNAVSVEDVDASMLKAGVTEEGHRQRKYHSREVKSRTKSKEQIQMKNLEELLAQHSIRFLSFNSRHRQACLVKKAGTCRIGWSGFKNAILSGKSPECNVCKEILVASSLDVATVASSLADKRETDDAKDATDGKDAADTPGEPAKEATKKPDDQKQSEDPEGLEFSKSMEYLQKLAPTIQIVMQVGEIVKYRCVVCKTRKQPAGKLNKIPKMNLKSVKFFMQQHLNSATHIAAENGARLQADLDTQPAVECPGLCVAEAVNTVLYIYREEFKVWSTHTKLNCPMTSHTYWADLNREKFWVRHKNCERNFRRTLANESCCSECFSLSQPTKLVKQVIRFITKFYAAQLLQKRLFCTAAETSEWVQQIQTTSFGLNCRKMWDALVALENYELQNWVRKTWASTPPEQRTSNLITFMDAFVEPALRVHVGSISSSLTVLASQYLTALCSEHNTVPWRSIL